MLCCRSVCSMFFEPSGQCCVIVTLVESKLVYFGYSYDQYHWCPIALIVRWAGGSSSVMYSMRIDGKTRNDREIAGKIVQMFS